MRLFLLKKLVKKQQAKKVLDREASVKIRKHTGVFRSVSGLLVYSEQ